MTFLSPKPLNRSIQKFCMIDKVGEISDCAKNHNNRSHGASPHIREISCFCVPFLRSYRLKHSPNESRTKVNDGSKDMLPVQEEPFLSPVNELCPERVENPGKNAKF